MGPLFAEPPRRRDTLLHKTEILKYNTRRTSYTEHGRPMSRAGEEIRRLREGKGWTQPRLSVEAGIAVSAISQIETGRRNPNAGTLEKLAAALDVEVADLFPKAEVPLPFKEEAQQRPNPFVEGWISFMLGRAKEWKDALPESAHEGPEELLAELRAKPQLAYELLRQNESVQGEAEAVARYVSRSAMKAVYGGIRSTEWRLEEFPRRLEEWADREEFAEALRVMDYIAEAWFNVALKAQDVVGRENASRAVLERAKQKAEMRRSTVSLFGQDPRA